MIGSYSLRIKINIHFRNDIKYLLRVCHDNLGQMVRLQKINNEALKRFF